MSTTTQVAEMLRRDLENASGPYPAGTAVRWTYLDRYTFVAVFTAGKWWITGNGRAYGGQTSFEHEDFVKRVLGQQDTTNIQVAGAWQDVMPSE